MISAIDLTLGAPILSMTVTIMLAILLESFAGMKGLFAYGVGLLGLTATSLFVGLGFSEPGVAFFSMVSVNPFSSFIALLVLVCGVVTMVHARQYLGQVDRQRGEFYILVLFAVTGMMLIGYANDLMIVFLGIELMSVSLYVLAGFFRNEDRSNEAALKYFLLGAFATGFLLYGIALVFGAAGSTNLQVISRTYAGVSNEPLFLLGMGMLIVGFGFKVAAVPFHMWAPDVYEGAPTVVTGLMASGAKAAAFAGFATVFIKTFDIEGSVVSLVIAYVSVFSMVLGNVVALAQTNLKRLLAYSSIAHAGYMLAGIASGSTEGLHGVGLYLAAYAVTTLGAFGVLAWMESALKEGQTVESLAGLSKRQPAVAALMALFMFSLTGIPPFAGFVGKYYVFMAAVRADMVWLAVIGVVTSAVGAYYYLGIVVQMYFREGEDVRQPLPAASIMVALAVSAVLIILIGVFPASVLRLLAPGL